MSKTSDPIVGGYAEAADYLNEKYAGLGITVSKLKRAVSAGRISHLKPNGFRVIFRESDLLDFIDRSTVKAVR